MRIPQTLLACLLGLATVVARAGEPAPFDLAGPVLEVAVTRGQDSLPIAQVPQLRAGDRIRLRAALPAGQGAHYLLVVAFLRGATNPPPESWFARCETWRECGERGLTLKVPDGAQQVLAFLAPATSGDFRTLVGAVRGRPGAFVRTSQDLNQAALDRERLETWLDAVHRLGDTNPDRLHEAAPLLARSLAVRIDEKCMERPPAQQAGCLSRGRDALILDDGHSATLVESFTSSPASDLALTASMTPEAKFGYYGPYVASLLDVARIFDSFRTARYQYLPALAAPQGEHLALWLNAAPSFHDPKSVLVAALPPVEEPQPPPLRAVDPRDLYCARRSHLVLPVTGAPLVFATQYARKLSLRIEGASGSYTLPLHPDAEQGGLVADTTGLDARLGERVQAVVQGRWGFESFEGPRFELINAAANDWSIAERDAAGLVVGRDGTLHLKAASVSCVDAIMAHDPSGKTLHVEWQRRQPDELELKLGLENAQPGAITLQLRQAGAAAPKDLTVQGFAEAGHLEGFTMHLGDDAGVLRGSRLDEVAALELGGVKFLPGTLVRRDGHDELPLSSAGVHPEGAKPGTLHGTVTLKDGRRLEVAALIEAPRPAARLLARSVDPGVPATAGPIRLAREELLPAGARLTFSLRSLAPAKLPRATRVEVATEDEAVSTTLALGAGGLVLADAHVAVATLDTAKAFGPSVYGPLKYRLVVDEVPGDWMALATLVRLPQLRDLTCTESEAGTGCTLSGERLFLVDAFAPDAEFRTPTPVPEGFAGDSLAVPHPTDGKLYVRLRDDPRTINVLELAVHEVPAASAAANPPAAGTQGPAESALPLAVPVRASAPALTPVPGGALAPTG